MQQPNAPLSRRPHLQLPPPQPIGGSARPPPTGAPLPLALPNRPPEAGQPLQLPGSSMRPPGPVSLPARLGFTKVGHAPLQPSCLAWHGMSGKGRSLLGSRWGVVVAHMG